MVVAQKELFGPAVCIIPVDNDEETVEVANDTSLGLSGAIHTKNLERGAELAKKIETGDSRTIHDEPLAAFGGEKQSGLGRLNGQ